MGSSGANKMIYSRGVVDCTPYDWFKKNKAQERKNTKQTGLIGTLEMVRARAEEVGALTAAAI